MKFDTDLALRALKARTRCQTCNSEANYAMPTHLGQKWVHLNADGALIGVCFDPRVAEIMDFIRHYGRGLIDYESSDQSASREIGGANPGSNGAR